MSRIMRWVIFAAALITAKLWIIPAIYGDSVNGLFPKIMMTEFKAGFAEVSPDFSGFAKKWKDKTRQARQQEGALAVAKYATREELLQIYRFRSTTFYRIANNPRLNRLCSGEMSDTAAVEAGDLSLMAHLSGRSMAREYTGKPAWDPPMDLNKDAAALQSFVKFVEDRHMTRVAAYIRDPARTGASATCMALGELYAVVEDIPDAEVGGYALIDFVRALELSGGG